MIERAKDWLGFQLVIYGWFRLTCNPSTRFGQWCLSRAGNHAYRDQIP